MDWIGCRLVETVEGKVSGQPLVVGTRIPADVIVQNFAAGSSVEEIQENYPSLSPTTIQTLLMFARAHQLQIAS